MGEEPGNLPLLEFALTRLWSKQENRVLTHHAYEEIGGVKKAIANHAEQIFQQLKETEKKQAERIFVQLVRPGEGTEDTRRVATRGEVGEDNWNLVSYLAGYQARLVVTGRNEQENTVEVVHEALIREWGTLRDWINASREFRTWQERLRATMSYWQENNRDQGALLRGVALAQAQEQLTQRQEELSPDEVEFIQLSQQLQEQEQKRKQRQRQRIFAGLVTFSVIISLLAVWSEMQRRQAVRSERKAEMRELKTRIISGERTLDLQLAALKLEQQANGSTENIQTTDILQQTVNWEGYKEINSLEGHENYVIGVAFSPKGDLIASASWDNTVKLWKPDGTLIHTLTGHENYVIGVAFSPKGDLIASTSWDNTVKLWKPDGTLIHTLTGHENYVIGVAFSPKGDLIASTSWDNTVKLWKPDGTLIHTLTGHENYVIGVAFSPKGDLIASTSNDNTVKLWRFNQDDLTAHACQWMSDYLKNNPNVTEEERRLCGVEASVTALFFQGEKLAAEGKVDSAISAFQKAVKLGSNFPFNAAIAKELAQENKVKEAEKLLRAFIKLDDNIDLLPKTEVKDQNPVLVVRQFQAEGKVKKAVQLIKDRKIEEAINKFKEAQKLQSDIDLNSDTEEIEIDAEAVAKKLAAPGKVEEGKYLAKDGKIEQAISLFKEAQKLQSDIDLNSDTEEIEKNPETVAKNFAALSKLEVGKTLAKHGEIDEAINLYKEAKKLDSELEITADDWSYICHRGSLYNRAKDVMFACEKAVKIAPENGGFIGSRGLARALTGDFPGAIKDFEAYIKWTEDDEFKARLQGWVDALKKGENPFTEEVLEELK
nr:hypothetical protein [Okeania sp. SIO1F9]